jgi:hypothetical protein
MSINYDPNKKPEITTEMVNLAKKLNLQLVNIICDEKEAQVGDPTGLSFITMTPFLPRPEDQIILESGSTYQVKQIFFSQTKIAENIIFFPNVYSHLLSK